MKKMHIECVYRVHSCSIFTFLNNFQTIIQQSFEHCPIIIMGDFKPIYITFKLPNTFPMYNKKTINVSIYLKCSVCENMHVNVAFST
jgi:hypothetical protein